MESDWDLCKRPVSCLSTPLLPAVNTVGHPTSCSHGPSSETLQPDQGMPNGYTKWVSQEATPCQEAMRRGYTDLSCPSAPLQGVMQCPLRRDRPARSSAEPVQCQHSP